MTPPLARIAPLARRLMRDTMGPWLATSLSLHAGLIAAILPNEAREERAPTAGGMIAVDVVLVEGPDTRSTAATGRSGEGAPRPDRTRAAERRAAPAAPDATRRPAAGPLVDVAGPAPRSPQPKSRVTANAPPATAAPAVLAPRPRPKPAPPVGPAARPRPVAPPEHSDAAAPSEGDFADPELAAVTPAPASRGGGSRGASPRPGNPMPVYPDVARRRGRQGRVVLRVEVRPDGAAGAVSIDRSSGDVRLDEAALAAVRQWRFRPALRNGVPVVARVRVPVRFRLR